MWYKIITNEKCTNCTYEINNTKKIITIKYKKNNVFEELKSEIINKDKLKLTNKITSGFNWLNWIEEVNGYPCYSVDNNPNDEENEQINNTYASEADVLNVALFGMTVKEWRTKNPKLKDNIRDYATIEQLIVLSNMESSNSIMIRKDIP